VTIFLFYVPRFLSVVDLMFQICLNYCSNIKFFHTEYLEMKLFFPIHLSKLKPFLTTMNEQRG
jgi:hypothetical protein